MISKKLPQFKKAIFLDRDGVINKKPPRGEYVKSWKEFEFLPGTIEALRILCQRDYDIFIVTNQAGIGRGLMDINDLELIHQKMIEELKKNGVDIRGIYYCSHEMNENCQCRKPKPGLLLRAAKEHNLDLTRAVFVGDDNRDLAAGNQVGCKVILIKPGKNLLDIVISLPE